MLDLTNTSKYRILSLSICDEEKCISRERYSKNHEQKPTLTPPLQATARWNTERTHTVIKHIHYTTHTESENSLIGEGYFPCRPGHRSSCNGSILYSGGERDAPLLHSLSDRCQWAALSPVPAAGLMRFHSALLSCSALASWINVTCLFILVSCHVVFCLIIELLCQCPQIKMLSMLYITRFVEFLGGF